MNVLLSVRPEFADAILDETKRYEFRRTIFKKMKIERVFIYSTAPVQRIIGAFTIGMIIHDQPMRLWEDLREQAGLAEDQFFDYFKGCNEGYAIEVKEVQPFKKPLNPWKLNPAFNPPQSFRYVDWRLNNTEGNLSFDHCLRK